MKKWTCEEWMDWCETVVPLIMYNMNWGRENQAAQTLFEGMWSRLRRMVLHYLRGNKERIEDLRPLDIAATGREYAKLAEQVSMPALLSNLAS